MLTAPDLPEFPPPRNDDPRLDRVIVRAPVALEGLRPGRPLLLGFPVDEGVRRNGGRIGAAAAPDAIRAWLYRLTATDAFSGLDLRLLAPLDMGNVRPGSTLEESQQALGLIVGQILATGAVPIILGGGHETAFGHYLGYCNAGLHPAIVNLDAHLDVRPTLDGLGTSGSPFRQAMLHETAPLEAGRYACLGIQPQATSQEHWNFCNTRGHTLIPIDTMRENSVASFSEACNQIGQTGAPIYLSVDADVACAADVPGVSAPNPAGMSGHALLACARLAGTNQQVRSFDLVEINPLFDIDGRSARWAATMVWHFLMGLCARKHHAR
jgi:formiminoglutamase